METTFQIRENVPTIIRSMEVGQQEVFPIEQHQQLECAIRRENDKHLRVGKKWTKIKDRENLQVIVSRIA